MEGRQVTDAGEDFWALGALIRTRKAKVGTLATAIEKHGVQGWDRFGRFREFAAGTDDARAALDALAEQFAHDSDEGLSPADLGEFGGPIHRYGWLASKMPAFDAIDQEEQKAGPPAPVRRRAENTDLRIIGCLLGIIKGEIAWPKHPNFKTEEDLIGCMVDEMGSLPGLRMRTLQGRFAEAKRALKPD